jgi:hypothetical protein
VPLPFQSHLLFISGRAFQSFSEESDWWQFRLYFFAVNYVEKLLFLSRLGVNISWGFYSAFFRSFRLTFDCSGCFLLRSKLRRCTSFPVSPSDSFTIRCFLSFLNPLLFSFFSDHISCEPCHLVKVPECSWLGFHFTSRSYFCLSNPCGSNYQSSLVHSLICLQHVKELFCRSSVKSLSGSPKRTNPLCCFVLFILT